MATGLARHARHTAAHALQSWLEHVWRERTLRSAYARVVRLRQERVLGSTFSAWEAVLVDARVLRRDGNWLAGKIAHRFMRRALEAWQVWMERAALVRTRTVLAFRRRCLELKRFAFEAWLDYAVYGRRKTRREALEDIASRLSRRLVASALRAWVDHWQEVRLVRETRALASFEEMRRSVASLRRRHVARVSYEAQRDAVAGWRAAVEHSHWRARNVIRIHAQARWRSLRSSFDAWQWWLVDMRDRKHVLDDLGARVVTRALRSAFTGWVDVWQYQRTQRVVLQRAFLRVAQRLILRAFASWVEFVSDLKVARWMRQRVARLESVVSGHSLRHALLSWVDFVSERLTIRAVIRKARAAVDFLRSRRAFLAWEEYWLRVSGIRWLTVRAARRRSDWLLRWSLACWVQYAFFGRPRSRKQLLVFAASKLARASLRAAFGFGLGRLAGRPLQQAARRE